jgi:glycosyltransferase involved in cell wall biosynthesis
MPGVVHLTPFPTADLTAPRPGVPTIVSLLVPALADAGVPRQVVVAARDGGPRVERLLPTVEVARAYRPGRRFREVGRLLATAPGSLVHAQHEVFLYGGLGTAVQFPLALRPARRRGRPVVVTVHGVIDLRAVDRGFVAANGSRLPPPAVRRALRRVIGDAARAGDAVIVHDRLFADRLEEQYGIPAERLRVIPLPVPAPVELDRDQARAGLGLTVPTALFFGFVTGYKGLPLLLDGWERYRRAGGAGELLVGGGRHPRLAGEPAYEREYAALEERARGIGGVRWTGYIAEEDVPAHLAAADLLVLPYRDSLAASGPMSSALAYGLPVIGSEAVRAILPDEAGVFARDPDALAAALRDALEGPLAGRLREASVRAGAEHSLPGVAARTADLYRELAA